MNMPEEDQNSGKIVDFNELKIDNLSYSYSGTPVLSNINLTAKKGEIIGISGPSGCGKSTIAKLIMKFISDEGMDGSITIDNVDLADIDNRYFRENSSIILQDSYLFNATIRDNINFFDKDLDKNRLSDALRNTNLKNFVTSLKREDQEIVGERSSKISSGQKQRLSVARSFYNDSKLLILDEATANIDIFSEIEVLKALEANKEDKITIIISHNKSTLSICDKIVKLEG
jgi:ABC transporter, ATP-binding/permease protein